MADIAPEGRQMPMGGQWNGRPLAAPPGRYPTRVPTLSVGSVIGDRSTTSPFGYPGLCGWTTICPAGAHQSRTVLTVALLSGGGGLLLG